MPKRRERQQPTLVALPNGGWMFADGSAICTAVPFALSYSEIDRALAAGAGERHKTVREAGR